MNLLLLGHMYVKIETNDGQQGAIQGSITELLYDSVFDDVIGEKPFPCYQ